jgi:hypothetical protein
MRKHRDRFRALGEVRAIRAVQLAEARQALAEADTCEREAQRLQDNAETEMRSAVTAWQKHLGGGAFQPELASMHALHLIERVARKAAASDALAERVSETGLSRDAWHASEARLRQAGELLADSCRKIARAQDERVLVMLADRTTHAWSRT